MSENIPGILVLSHGPLCEALIESAEMICGPLENVKALPFLSGADLDEYGKSAKECYDAMPEGSIILFDLFGGTPFNQMIARNDGKSSMHGLCGVNLPLLIEAANLRMSFDGQDLIDKIKEAAGASIVDLEEFLTD